MMQFTLTGFRQDTGIRVFAFEGTADDRTRTAFTVRTDLALSRRYGIQLQELPLLCRGLLERRDSLDVGRTVTFTEEEMQLHATGRAAEREAAQRRKAPRRPPARNPQTTHQPGSEWRGPQRPPAV
jgi:hypothetical protein